jgi:hypothetical protein
MSLQNSKSPLFFFVFEILLVKLVLHSASLEFPILCQHHIIVIIRLLFYSSHLSCLVSSLYLSLCSTLSQYIWLLFYSHSFRISYPSAQDTRERSATRTSRLPLGVHGQNLSGARSDLSTLPRKTIPSFMDNPTAMARSLNLWPNHYTDWNKRLHSLLFWLGRREEQR